MSVFDNPFTADPDRAAIWDMLVTRDIDAFLSADWGLVDGDFLHDQFFGIDAKKAGNPDHWAISFPALAAYRDEWLRQAAETAKIAYAEDVRTGIFRATSLAQIDITGDRAIAHKKFDGTIAKQDGTLDVLNWQTLYFLRKTVAGWKLTGFVGYMPYPMGKDTAARWGA